MGVFTYHDDEKTSTVPPSKLYKALVLDSDELIPKVLDSVQSVEIVEGNGGPGTVKKLTFVEGGETKYVLQKVEEIDEANYGYKYSIIGGSGIPETVEKITFESKLEEGPNGGSKGKVTVTYFTKTDAPPSEEEINTGKAKGQGLFRAIEAYVLANP
ncbi:hypothetical protein K1719_005913 [Acacia pycnantha]|nr:hypothetical protein K1719_005913 [Acacia pycnantha]